MLNDVQKKGGGEKKQSYIHIQDVLVFKVLNCEMLAVRAELQSMQFLLLFHVSDCISK